MSGTWIKVLDLDVLNHPDFTKKVKADGKVVCLVKDGTRIFAIDYKCPHAGADLSHGWCKQGRIVCPYHRHEFDLSTGRGLEGQGNAVRTYPVEIRKDGIYILKPKSWWIFW